MEDSFLITPGAYTNKKKKVLFNYWKSLSREDQEVFFKKVRVLKLKNHLSSLSLIAGNRILSQSLCFAKKYNSWQFWKCCCCILTFPDSDLYLSHVYEKHLGLRISSKKFSVRLFPSGITRDWENFIRIGNWKPVDSAAALVLLEELWTSLFPTTTSVDNLGFMLYEYDAYSVGITWARTEILMRYWPVVEDAKHQSLLDRIVSYLKQLLDYGLLTWEHLQSVTRYALHKLEQLLPGSKKWKLVALDQTHLCLCLLGPGELQHIADFLCQIDALRTETNGVIKDEYYLGFQQNREEKIVLDDKGILSLYIIPPPHVDDASSVLDDRDSLPDSETLIEWVSTGLSAKEQMKSWVDHRKKIQHQGETLYEMLEEKYQELNHLLEKKIEELAYMRSLYKIWAQCMKDPSVEHYESRILWFKEQLQAEKNTGAEYALKAIADLFDKVSDQHNLVNDTTGECSLAIFKDGYASLELPEDTLVKEALKSLHRTKNIELLKTGALIKRKKSELSNLNVQMATLGADDYRAILSHLVKSFIQAQLQQPTEEYARKKDKRKKDKRRCK